MGRGNDKQMEMESWGAVGGERFRQTGRTDEAWQGAIQTNKMGETSDKRLKQKEEG